jgi:hypothetical protein
MTYLITSDIAYTSTKSEIKTFAKEHGCTLKFFQPNGPAGGNHLCVFSSKNIHYIQELCDQLQIPHSNICTSSK